MSDPSAHRLGRHLRRHGVAYAALVVAVSLSPVPSVAADLVTTAEIANGAVTTPKLAADSVTSSRIANESVTSADIKNGTIKPPDLAAPPWISVQPASDNFNCEVTTGEFCASPVGGIPGVHGWVNYGADLQPARFRRDVTEEVTLQGLVRNANIYGDPATIFVLPVGYRPAARLIFPVVCRQAAAADDIGGVDIYPNGAVSWRKYDSNCDSAQWVSLTGISFTTN